MRFRKARNPHTLHALCGTSTKIAAGALGFRVEFDNCPEGGRENGKDPQIISRNHRGDGQLATEPFGPLKTILESISTVYARYEETAAISNKARDLVSCIPGLEAIFAAHPGDVKEDELLRLKGIVGRLRTSNKNSALLCFTNHVQAGEDVSEILGDLQEAIIDYRVTQQKANYDRGCKLIGPAEAFVLANFHCAQGAGYRDGDRGGCLNGTCETVLGEIELWTRGPDKSPVLWLNGLAGTGKSAIAQTIAKRLLADGRLGASFFCSRDFEDRSDLKLIFPTLAVQLAYKYPEFRSAFVPLVQSDPGIAHESLCNQMERLIVQPLRESGISTVIVIDALDECEGREPASAILSIIGQFLSQIPEVKFLLTGRPGRRIRESFHVPQMTRATDVFVLREVELSRVDSDVRLFFRHKFSEIKSRRRGPDDWPTENELDMLCERAAGRFVYAVATVKFVDHGSNDPREQLDSILRSLECNVYEGRTMFKTTATLYSLYMSIFQDGFGKGDLENDTKVRSVLGAVVLATVPLPPSAIAALLDFDVEDVFTLLSSIHSLLILREDVNHPVRPFHKSFPDFVVDPTRCTNQRFRVSPPEHHSELLMGCLNLMNRKLEKNMCKIPDAVTNSEMDNLRERAERYIDYGLRYACESWHKHLVGDHTARIPEIVSALHLFLEGKFLFWLEVLSVLDGVKNAVRALDATRKWLTEIDSPDALALVDDCFRFVTVFFDVIAQSSMHIFRSALALAPKTSIIRKLHGQDSHPFATVVRGVPDSWESSIASAKRLSPIETVTWSPCSRFIAITCADSAIEILDPVTLERLCTMRSPLGTRVLAFSPDSRLLLCCGLSPDWLTNFIASWDVQTGDMVGVGESEKQVKGRPSAITSSVDGGMIGVVYVDHLTPDEFTICAYKIGSGQYVYAQAFRGWFVHIWTHEQYFQFAAMEAGLLTVWEVELTLNSRFKLVDTFDFPENLGSRGLLSFFPTLYRLAYIVQGTILIWDAQRRKSLLYAEDARFRGSTMTFSSNGRFFACGTTGPDIYIWEESPTGYTLRRKVASSTLSPVPLFSPDETSIITWDSSTIRLWPLVGPSTLTPYNPPQVDDPPEPFLLDFFPGRSSVAVSRRTSNTVEVFDLKTSVQPLIIDAGMRIRGLRAFSDTVVVEGLYKFVTWKLPEGDNIPGITLSVEDSVNTTTVKISRSIQLQSTSILPDLLQVATCRVVLWATQAPQLLIYDVPTADVLATIPVAGDMVWFSQDGSQVWCGGEVGEEKGWRVVKSDGSGQVSLDPLVGNPPEGYPWRSSRGYTITDDGWILGLEGKRLFWLPPDWRSHERGTRVWSGPFLALLHNTLSKPVILELEQGI